METDNISYYAYLFYKMLATLWLIAAIFRLITLPIDSVEIWVATYSIVILLVVFSMVLGSIAFYLTLRRQFYGIEKRLLILMFLTIALTLPISVILRFKTGEWLIYIMFILIFVYGISVWLISWKK